MINIATKVKPTTPSSIAVVQLKTVRPGTFVQLVPNNNMKRVSQEDFAYLARNIVQGIVVKQNETQKTTTVFRFSQSRRDLVGDSAHDFTDEMNAIELNVDKLELSATLT